MATPPPPYTILRGHGHEVSVVRFQPWAVEPMHLISGDVSGCCHFWNVLTRRSLVSFRACDEHQSVLEVCSPSPSAADTIITFVFITCRFPQKEKKKKFLTFIFSYRQAKEGTVRIWSLAEGAARVSEQWNTRAISLGHMAACCNGERMRIATPLENGSDVGVFDGTGKLCMTISPALTGAGAFGQKSGGMAMACSWLDNTEKLLVAYEDGTVRCYDTSGSSTMPLFSRRTKAEPTESDTCTSLAIMPHLPSADGAPSGWRCVLGTAGPSVSVFDIDPGSSAITEIAECKLPRNGVNDVAVRRYDGKIFASAGWDHRVRIFALGCGTHSRVRPLAVLRFHSESVTSVDFAPKDSILASGSRDTSIALWKLY